MEKEAKIGVLYPQSVQYKNLGSEFMRGLKLAGLPVKFVIEGISIGADERMIIDKMQKLHLQDDIQIFVAFTGHNNIQSVYSFAEENNIILLACDLGATLPYNSKKYKGVYINSYALNESVYLLGKYLNQKGYKSICSSASYYDAGYGLLSALEHAVTETGTSFSGHYITPFQPRENEPECMEQHITATRPDVVVAFHSGLYAREHGGFITQTSLLDKIPYYVTPFTLNGVESKESKIGDFFIVGSWMPDNGDTKSCDFITAYDEKYGAAPSVFAMLGYEASLLLEAVTKSGESSYKGICKILDNFNAKGPRGVFTIDAETNRTFFNHYIYKTIAYDETKLRFEKVATLENGGDFLKNILQQPAPEKLGGWHNAYLCH